MSLLPALVVNDSGARAPGETSSLEWRLLVRGTRPIRTRIVLALSGGHVESAAIRHGILDGSNSTADIGEWFIASPGDVIEAMFDVTPDPGSDIVEVAAVLQTETSEHRSPPIFLKVESRPIIQIAWEQHDEPNMLKVAIKAISLIKHAELFLDAPPQINIGTGTTEMHDLAGEEQRAFEFSIDADDDDAIVLGSAYVLADGVAFALPAITIQPTRIAQFNLTSGATANLLSGEQGEAWFVVTNPGLRARLCQPSIEAHGITVSGEPRPRTIEASMSERWAFPISGGAPGSAQFSVTVGEQTNTESITVERIPADMAINGAASFDTTRGAEYRLAFSVKDIAHNARLVIHVPPGLHPVSVIGIGDNVAPQKLMPFGEGWATPTIADANDHAEVIFVAEPIASQGTDQTSSIEIIERTWNGHETLVDKHRLLIRSRAILDIRSVGAFDRPCRPGESAQLLISAHNIGGAQSELPFAVTAPNFVSFTWSDGTAIGSMLHLRGHEFFDRKLIATVGNVPAGGRSTTVSVSIGKETFTRALSFGNVAHVFDPHVIPHADGIRVIFANGGSVDAANAQLIIRGADIAYAVLSDGTVIPSHASEIRFGKLASGATIDAIVHVTHYLEDVSVSFIVDATRHNTTFLAPADEMMPFGATQNDGFGDPAEPIADIPTETTPEIEANPTIELPLEVNTSVASPIEEESEVDQPVENVAEDTHSLPEVIHVNDDPQPESIPVENVVTMLDTDDLFVEAPPASESPKFPTIRELADAAIAETTVATSASSVEEPNNDHALAFAEIADTNTEEHATTFVSDETNDSVELPVKPIVVTDAIDPLPELPVASIDKTPELDFDITSPVLGDFHSEPTAPVVDEQVEPLAEHAAEPELTNEPELLNLSIDQLRDDTDSIFDTFESDETSNESIEIEPIPEPIVESAEEEPVEEIDDTPFTADQLLGHTERLMLTRLLRVKPRVRAMHAFIVGLLVDGETEQGKALRQNLIAALAASAVNLNLSANWTLVPESVRTWLADGGDVPTEAEAVGILADLLSQQNVETNIVTYLNAVQISFSSLAGLEPNNALDRLFSPADRLDEKFDAAFHTTLEIV